MRCGRVAYARDAFDGLHLMDKVTGNGFDDYLAAVQAKRKGKARNEKRTLGTADPRGFAPVDVNYAQERRRRLTAGEPIPDPPFWGARVIEAAPKAVVPFINERSLYQFQWGFRKQGRSLEDFLGWAKQELRPVLKRMLALTDAEQILRPQAIYGYWKCAGQGNDLVLFEPDGVTEACRFTLPRQPKQDGECIPDFVRDIEDGPNARDVIGLQVVTVGQKASDIARPGSRTTATRTTSTCTACRSRWRRRWRSTSTSASAPNGASAPRTTATWTRCCNRATAAAGTPSATRLPAAGGPGAAAQAAGRGARRRVALRRVAAPPGAVHQRDRAAPPAGEVLLRLAAAGLESVPRRPERSAGGRRWRRPWPRRSRWACWRRRWSAGFFWTWSFTVMPGFAAAPPEAAVAAMRAVNANIVGPGFAFVFFGPAVLAALSAALAFAAGLSAAAWPRSRRQRSTPRASSASPSPPTSP